MRPLSDSSIKQEITPNQVSVVVPHYGDAEQTLHLVDQLHAQLHGDQLEIIVSDDCSPEPFPSDVEGIKVVWRQVNGGFASAVNSGVSSATRPYILIMNSDVELPESFLQEMVEFGSQLMPAVIAPRVLEPWGERIMGRYWPTVRGMTLESLMLSYRLSGSAWYERTLGNNVASVTSAEPTVVDWAVGVCLFMPREDFNAVGGMDESFFMNCEEIDLQKRLHEDRSLPVYILPSPTLQHAGGGSSPNEKRAGWLIDSRFRYYEKWNGGPQLYLAMMAAAGTNLVWQYARRAAGRPLKPLETWRAEVTRIEHGWRSRR